MHAHKQANIAVESQHSAEVIPLKKKNVQNMPSLFIMVTTALIIALTGSLSLWFYQLHIH